MRRLASTGPSPVRRGGGGGNRTHVQGFADLCLGHSATPPEPGRLPVGSPNIVPGRGGSAQDGRCVHRRRRHPRDRVAQRCLGDVKNQPAATLRDRPGARAEPRPVPGESAPQARRPQAHRRTRSLRRRHHQLLHRHARQGGDHRIRGRRLNPFVNAAGPQGTAMLDSTHRRLGPLPEGRPHRLTP